MVDAKAVVNVTGLVGTTQLGTASVVAKGTVYVIGVVGTGEVGNNIFTLVWGEIDTSQTPNWTEIAA